MTVYAEVVFLSNFFIDLFISVFTAAVLKMKIKKFRLFFAAVFGATMSTIYPIIGSYRYAIKVLCVIIMVFILSGIKNIKKTVTTLFTFCATTFILGGIVQFMISFVNINLTHEDFTYGIVPIIISAACIGIIVLADVLRKEFVKVRQKNGLYYNVRIKNGSYEGYLRAFYDSGNRVYANNGEPVIFVVEKIYNKLAAESDGERVEIATANGISSVPICRANLQIYFDDGRNIIYKVAAGKLSTHLDAEILLHSDMQGE